MSDVAIKGLAFYQTYVAGQKYIPSTSRIRNFLEGRPNWGDVKYPAAPGDLVPQFMTLGAENLSSALSMASHLMAAHAVGDEKDKFFGYAISEPGAGSDAEMIASTVRLTGDNYSLTGEKCFVVNADRADYFLVFAKGAGSSDEERSRLSVFRISANRKGITKTPREMMGLSEAGIADLAFDNVRVGRDEIVGQPGEGFAVARKMLDYGRLAIAASALGAARKVYDFAVRNAGERCQFGKSIIEFPMVREKFVAISESLYAMEAAVSRTASDHDAGRDYSAEAAVSKIFCVREALRTAREAVGIAGATAYARDSEYAKTLRDLEGLRFVCGTEEVLKLYVALYGAKPVADYLAQNRKGQKSVGWFDAVAKLWWRGMTLTYSRPRKPRVDRAVREAARILAESSGIAAERTFQIFKYYGAEVTSREYELRRLADMAIEIFVLESALLRADGQFTRFAADAVNCRARHAWKRIARWSSEIFVSDDLELERSWGGRLLAVIGDPIEHSKSPLIHGKAIAATGVDFVYSARRVTDVGAAIAAMRSIGIRGYSVTIPHKEAVIPFLDELDVSAERCGSVNTVVNCGGQLKGYSTDGAGAVMALERAGVNLKNARVRIIGTGGAARAIAFALLDAQIASISFQADDQAQARKLTDDLNRIKKIVVDDAAAEILINASPVGMHPNVDTSPVDLATLPMTRIVFDIVYNPVRTKLLRDADARGLKIVEGIGMFAEQAALQFELFTGSPAPRDLMYQTVRDALA